jgi:drug/metabolite transporter (DMT)-like permease
MIKNPAVKGYLWTFLSVIALSNVYIFSKAALNEVHIAQFGFYWFGLGMVWNLIFTVKTCKLSTIRKISRKTAGILIVIGVLETAATTLFFLGLFTIENPSVTSFLGNMGPIFVTILGVSLLKERFNNLELFGMLLTLTGAFIISYRGSDTIGDIFIKGTGYVVLGSLVFSFSTIIVKKNVGKSLSPAIISLNRTIFLFVFAFVMMFVFRKSFSIPASALLNISIGSVLGPFLAVVAGYNALKYIEASRTSILGSTKSLFVLFGSYLYFHNFPQTLQIIGGILTIIGVMLISFGKIIVGKNG